MKKMSILKAFVAISGLFVVSSLQSAFAFGNYSFSGTSYYDSSLPQWGLMNVNADGTSVYGYNYNNSSQAYNPTPSYSYGYIVDGGTTQVSSQSSYNQYEPTTCEATIYRTLSYGMTGNDVATVQDYLHDQDFLQATPNGYFGYGTKTAVKSFQNAYGISATGAVGPQTRSILNNLICGGDSHITSQTTLAPSTVSSVTEIAATHVNTPVQINIPTAVSTPSYTVGNQSVYIPSTPTSGSLYNPLNDLYYKNQNERATLTVTLPQTRSQYREGDTMNVSWFVTNMTPTRFIVTLDNTSTGLVRQIGIFDGSHTSVSITLTKDVLDTVCAGTSACALNNANSYRITVIAFGTSVPSGEYSIKGYVDQIAIIRPYTAQSLSIVPSKTPVNSGETINLYVSVPATAGIFSQYSSLYWKIHSVCATNVALTVNGQVCGTDSFVYQTNIMSQPNITATLVNNSWGPQQVTFVATAYDFYGGNVLGTATTQVTVNK